MDWGRCTGALVPAEARLALTWIVLVAAAIAARPLLPIDETRYLAVAWEMHRTGDWLVPHLNGIGYAHKPPLMFWLINAGWIAFGVAEWWARLVSPLAALCAALVTGALARRLFPELDARTVFVTAATILLGTSAIALYSTMVLFDTMMVLFAVIGVYGLVVARNGARWGFALFGLAIGLGLLTKGPVILVYTLPPAIFAPLWIKPGRVPYWAKWYCGIGSGIAIGGAIGLAWAIPAAIAGGEAYAGDLLWKQSSGRVIESFAHRKPFWWYLAILPVIVFPWSAWPPLWRAIARLRWSHADEGTSLCAVWLGGGIMIMSLVSGKQPHYILPLFPALAIFLSRHVASRPPSRRDQFWPALILAVIGGVLITIALLEPLRNAVATAGIAPADTANVALITGPALIVIAGAGAWIPAHQGQALAAFPILALIALEIAIRPVLQAQYDVETSARFVSRLQHSGHRVAVIGEYHGELQFAGRLAPLEEIEQQDLPGWAAHNPDGYVVAFVRNPPEVPAPEYAQRVRGRILAIWRADVVGRALLAVTAH